MDSRRSLSKKRARSSHGCRPCKSRRVKCDESPETCNNCVRLGFKCVYETGVNSPNSGPPEADEPLPKRRATHACRLCRSSKLRCSGDVPKCKRCLKQSLECIYEQVCLIKPPQNSSSQPRENDAPRTTSESRVQAVGTTLDPRKFILQQHIDAYFQYIHATGPYNFIHKGSFLRAWHTGSISKSLLRVVTGVASRFIVNKPKDEGSLDPGSRWVDDVENEVLCDMESVSIPRLQIMLLLVFDRFASGRLSAAWHILSLASRQAFALGLNNPTKAVLFTNQECRRRLMWCTFIMDKLIGGGGLSYPSMCPRESIHLTVPCNNRLFNLELDRDTDVLDNVSSDRVKDVDNVGVTAYLIRILDLRDKIQTLLRTEANGPMKSSLWNEGGSVKAIWKQLVEFQSHLPPEMGDTERALYLRVFTPEADVYTMAHTWLHTAGCELFGHFLGIKLHSLSGVTQTVPWQGAETEIFKICRQELARHAHELHRFWIRLHSVQRYSTRFFVKDMTIGPCVLVNTRSLLYLAGDRASDEGRESRDNESTIKAALRLNLEILTPISEVIPYVDAWLHEVVAEIKASPYANILDGFSYSRQERDHKQHSALSLETILAQARKHEDDRFPNFKPGERNARMPTTGIEQGSVAVPSAQSTMTSTQYEHVSTPRIEGLDGVLGEEISCSASELSTSFTGFHALCLYGDTGNGFGSSILDSNFGGNMVPDYSFEDLGSEQGAWFV